MLDDKNAIIYGAAGSIGTAVARAFALHGATVHLAGRTRKTLEAVAEDIAAAGGRAEVAVVDALDEQAVAAHAEGVVERAGSLDVSFNLVSHGDLHGVPLADMAAEDFLRPATTAITTNFITARTAARLMSAQGSGVVLTLNSGSAKGSPMMGGTGPADAAVDTLVRNLALEAGPSGVRVVGIWTAGIPETMTREKLAATGMDLDDAARDGLFEQLAKMRMLRRNPTLGQIAATAAFLASDAAGAITATFVNATAGIFTD